MGGSLDERSTASDCHPSGGSYQHLTQLSCTVLPTRTSGLRSRLTRAWFDWYCPFALRRHFHATRGYGEPLPTATSPGDRLVVAATHQSFWDPIVLNALLAKLGWRRIAMIDRRQVRRHPFFRRCGGFGVDLDDPADRRRALRYAIDQLRSATHATALVIFPQGRIEPPGVGLDGPSAGAELIARRASARLVWLALDYPFWFAQRPEVLVATGDSLADAHERVRQATLQYDPGRRLLGGRGSIKNLRLRRAPSPDEREARLEE